MPALWFSPAVVTPTIRVGLFDVYELGRAENAVLLERPHKLSYSKTNDYSPPSLTRIRLVTTKGMGI